MGTLANTANERFDKIKKRGTLPPWWLIAQIACGIVLFAFIAFKAIAPSNSDPSALPEPGRLVNAEVATNPTAEETGGSEVVPGEGDVDPSDVGPDPNELPSSGTTDVRAADETTVSVPNEALNVARLAVLAKFTGDFGQVPLLEGVVAPPASGTYPDAAASEPLVSTYSESGYSITFSVDTDGSGEDVRRIGAGVTQSGGEWVWTGS